MEFRLLGPVEARDDTGAPIALPPRLRGILAVLLLHSGRPVHPKEVLDRLCEQDQPLAKDSLYRYKSALHNKIIGSGVEWPKRKGFWQLDVPSGSVDYHRFLDSWNAAKQGGATVAHCRSALAEWNGDPLGGIDGPGVDQLRTRMDTQRRQCGLLLAETLREQGSATDAITELDCFPQSWELDESIIQERMRALSAAGRQAELSSYVQWARGAFRDMGLELGRPVHELHQRLLNAAPHIPSQQQESPQSTAGEAQWALAGGVTKRGIPQRIARRPDRFRRDPRAASAAAANAASPRPGKFPDRATDAVPHQLPPAISSFVDRDELFDELLGQVDAGTTNVRLLILEGRPGVGKSALALRVAHVVADRFPDGQLYANLQGVRADDQHAAADMLRGFLTSLGAADGTESSTVLSLAAKLRSVLNDRRVLLVLDNVRHPGQVEPLLPGRAGCLAVVTSTHRLEGLAVKQDAHRVELHALDTSDAVRLLRHHLPAQHYTPHRETLAELAGLCGNLPLALSIAAGIAARHPDTPLAELNAELRRSRHRIDALDLDGDLALRATFATAHDGLPPATKELFALLALHPGPWITTASAAALSGGDATGTARALHQLAHVRLLDEPHRHRYCLPGLGWDYAQAYAEELLEHGQSYAARRRVLDYFVHSASHAKLTQQRRESLPGPPQTQVVPETFPDYPSAMGWLEDNLPNLTAAVDMARRRGFHEHAWRIAWYISDFLNVRSHVDDWIATHVAALESAGALQDPQAEAITRTNLGSAHLRAQHYPEVLTLFSGLPQTFRQLDDHDRQAWVHNLIGWTYNCLRKPAEAGPHHKLALRHFSGAGAGNEYGHAHTLNYLCWADNECGAAASALSYGLHALELFDDIDEPQGLADNHHSVARAYAALGRHDDARDHFEQAWRLWDVSGDQHRSASVLADLHGLYRAMGERELAEQTRRRALRILELLEGHRDAERLRMELDRADGYQPGPPV